VEPAQLGFATLFIDLDGFKAVNDEHGHERGDAVLKRVAEILHAELRDSDVATRLGGDEFAICMETPLELSQAVATKVAERIVDKIQAIGQGIGASVGISTSRDNIDSALNEADEAMYSAKKGGKNRSSFYRAPPKLVVAA
jgi:diguanylate cyclase (GGDEF)-like protein